MPSYALGIDIGGTFTDIVVYDHDSGRQWSRKVLTTHDDPVRAVVAGVGAVLGDGHLEPRHFTRVVHATTLFTNALIERKGAVTGLITTAGFGDTLEIGRERKFELYDLNIAKPEPLVPRNLRLEVAERVKADGSVRQPLDRGQLLASVERLAAGGVASIAVVFLHAYANPRHEAEAVRLIAERHPEVFTTASHEVAPEIREFERASTTVANAYIKPLAHQYLGRMARQLAEQRIPAPLLLMLSSGGLTHVAEAQRAPVQMLESGPAAGAIAASFFGREDSGGNLLAFDMGGTTAKLSLVDGGEPLTAYSFEAARQKRFIEGSGLPMRISTIELIEIGAGGGSIAHVDEIGLLKVGPRSAGSQPGPACYALGGTEATVTDADLVLGYLNAEYFAGGTIAIDVAAARRALTRVAEAVRLPLVEVAWGVHDIVNENMASAARVHIAERGRDPRDYALLCTGGAGPVHACHVARKLGLREVICPPSAGVASALGLLVAPWTASPPSASAWTAAIAPRSRRRSAPSRTRHAPSWPTPASSSRPRASSASPTGVSWGRGSTSWSHCPTVPTTDATRTPRDGRSRRPSRRRIARSSRSHRPTCRSSSSTSVWPCALPSRAVRSYSRDAPAVGPRSPSRGGGPPGCRRPAGSSRRPCTIALASRSATASPDRR